MNKNPKLYNAVMLKDMMQIMKDSEEYNENVFTELAELARLMVEKRIQVIVL